MGKFASDTVMDAALGVIDNATRLVVCSGQPANFAGIAAVALADVVVDSGDFTIADGDISGRKVTIGAQTAIPVDSTGTATHVCLDNGSTLLYVTTCPSLALTASGIVNVPAFDIEIGDAGTGAVVLTVSDAWHAHAVDNLVLSLPGGGPGPGPNEPPGLTQIAIHDFTGALGDGGWDYGGALSIVSTPTGPAGEFLYEAPYSMGGSAPGYLDHGLGQKSVVYFRFKFQRVEPWTHHPAGVGDPKILYIPGDEAGGGDPFFLIMTASDILPGRQHSRLGNSWHRPGVASDTDGANESPNEVGYEDDAIQEIEGYLVAGDADVANGEVHIWQDGVKTVQYTSVPFFDTNPHFVYFNFHPVYGGVAGGSTSVDMRLRYWDVYLSGN